MFSLSTSPRVGLATATAYTVPTDRPESDATLAWEETTIVVVELAAGGEAGIGYTYAPPPAAALVESLLAPVVEGADPLAPPRAWAAMQRAARNAGLKGLGQMAIAAVDVALWDLRAKLLGLSLADSLGRFQEAVAAYGSGGFTSYPDDVLAGQLRGWAEAGFDRVKIKVGRDPERDPERLRVARQAIGPEVELMVDANGGFGRREAERWAHRYAEWDVAYFEEPVSSEDVEGLRRLRERVPPGMQIAAGEYAADVDDLERLAGCVDVLQGDVTRCGGITGLRRADAVCRAHHLPFSAHCAPQASAHLCCATETALHVEYFHDHVRIESLLFDGALRPEGGALRPDPTRPGLGIELKRADAERYRA